MDRLVDSIKQQLEDNENAYGLVAINGPELTKVRLIDTPNEGNYIDLLRWYREIICALFGIPPMKLGIVETGKLANPEQQLDTWYDVIESVQNRLELVINNVILKEMGIDDYYVKFRSPRPSHMEELSRAFFQFSQGVSMLKAQSAISTNESRDLINMIVEQEHKLPMIEEGWANDPTYVPPDARIYAPGSIMPPQQENEEGTSVEEEEGGGEE